MQDQTIIILAAIAAVVVLAAIILSKKTHAKINKEGFEFKTDKDDKVPSAGNKDNVIVSKIKNRSNVKVTKPKDTNVKIDDVSDSKIDIK